jgi:hypothetical protein
MAKRVSRGQDKDALQMNNGFNCTIQYTVISLQLFQVTKYGEKLLHYITEIIK